MLSEALAALEDRWAGLDDDFNVKSSALYAVLFKLATRSVLAALSLNRAWGRLLYADLPTVESPAGPFSTPGFLDQLSAEGQRELESRLVDEKARGVRV